MVINDEKVRVCYLINQISEKIDKEKRSEWIEAMLRITGNEQEYKDNKTSINRQNHTWQTTINGDI